MPRSSSNLQQPPQDGVPQRYTRASCSHATMNTRRQDALRRPGASVKDPRRTTTRTSISMRLPGCHELESGVPAPGSLWARTSDDLSFGKVPLLNGSFQPVWSSPATKQLGGSDTSRSIRPTASPDDAPPAIMTPSTNHLPAELSPALLFSSLWVYTRYSVQAIETDF
ncbi:hypothetical protein PENSPDRAFT_421896 [Peniophora sp. CONT]|nr:hypothetical protein PENSPDRAFT_421896 [Peniophora sp. CONT]